MIEQFFSDPAALQRLRAGPLGIHIDVFAQRLLEQGYAESTIRHKIRLVAHLSRWLRRRRLSVEELDERQFCAFYRYRGKQSSAGRSDMLTFRQLLKHLHKTGVIAVSFLKDTDSQLRCIESDYAQYLLQERGLACTTVTYHLRTVRRFLLERCGAGVIKFGELGSKDVTDFVAHHLHDRGPASARAMATYLRSFYRFLHQRGEIATDLAASIPAVANWRLSTIPKFLEPEQIERLLESCNQSSPTGQRDYAVLLLLARLGLRGGEVANMVLDDIAWASGEFIVRGKSEREDRLPMPQDVGEALVRYLRQGRPGCASRRVFIRAYAPHQGFSSPVAICDIVRRAAHPTKAYFVW